ncbi:hypothetical protein TrRE_jg13370, partial [Triparma retinervis]
MAKPRAKRKRGLSNLDTIEDTLDDDPVSQTISDPSLKTSLSSSGEAISSSPPSPLSLARRDSMSIATYPRTHIRNLLRFRLYSVSTSSACSSKLLSAFRKEEESLLLSPPPPASDYVRVPQAAFGYLESFATAGEIREGRHLDPRTLQVPACYSATPCSSST